MTNNRYPVLKKNLIFVAMIALFSLLQLTENLFTLSGSIVVYPLLSIVISIGMFEGELYGTVYGAVCGVLWDVCYGGIDGIHALLLALLGVSVGLLFRLFLRQKVKVFALVSAVSTILTCLLFYLVEVYVPLGDKNYTILLTEYIPSAILTFAFSFILYAAVKFVHGKFDEV